MAYLSPSFERHVNPKTAASFLIKGFLWLWLMLPLMVTADTSHNIEEKCGESEIRYVDDPTLTREERLAKMHQAFIDSVNRFEACELSNQTSATDNSANAGSGAAGGNGGAENTATASQNMQGTEAPLAAETYPEIPAEQFTGENALEKPPGIDAATVSAKNGAIPEDIPAANNDDAVAAQIRLAAENETDPEIREKLWNEYRKYKGLKIAE